MSNVHLCIHGHFYQPPRENPFTGSVDREPAAAPYHDFNEKIWDECYRPNAAGGNAARMSFDIGPTLAQWLQQAHPSALHAFTRAAATNHRLTGYGNALAQAYHHTILPLATSREKQLELAWGLRDFQRRYGYAAEGLWLPETAADAETLELLAAQGVRFTILAPWQAGTPDIATDRPYRVDLATGHTDPGRTLDVFFYNNLSGAVSFDDAVTADAARFVTEELAAQAALSTPDDGAPGLVLIATDGELYGHHKPFRDLFLKQLLEVEAPRHGYTVTALARYLALYPPTASATVRDGTSWSCHHGVARWDEGCACTPGDSSWKRPLRQALRALATRLDEIFEAETRDALQRPWQALEHYLDLRDGAVTPPAFWRTHARRTLGSADELRLRGLLEMQWARHAMFVSCAWFFEDLDRLEPRIALAQAHRAVMSANRHSGADLQPAFLDDLAASFSVRTGRSAADIYDEFARSVAA